jgi:para-nitrobenzyl esterase
MKKLTVTIIYILGMLDAFGQGKNGFAVQVKIENGIIEGLYDTKSGIQTYFGIPFAKPPVGELRWKAPQSVDNWPGVLQTKEFAPRPVQQLIWDDMHSRSNGVSEDCLYLNVWTPARRNTTGLPVLLYFYGGGFVAGDASEPRYDGESMAKKGIVVVTVNYRLNIFGFLAHPELTKEPPYKGSGNYGLLDQNAGLNWVVRNIAAFGGDPKKITIAGESAGSISVSAHLVSPLSRNLIRGAIGESGAAINPTLSPVPLAEAEKTGLEFAQKAGYPTLAQLRALSTRELYELYQESGRFGFPTVIDNYFYKKNLVETYKAKEQAEIPLLLGWNSAEGGAGGVMQGLPYTKENYEKKVKEMFPNDYAEVLKLYHANNEKEIERSATAISSDRFISYSTWKWFDLHRKNSNQPVYRYLYSKLRPPLVGEDPKKAAEAVGAPHACEIEYCMGNLHRIKNYAWTEGDRQVSETMLSYFANFIISGNPNGNNLPQWPAADKNDEAPPVMIIDVESKTVQAQDDKRYLFLDKFYKNN